MKKYIVVGLEFTFLFRLGNIAKLSWNSLRFIVQSIDNQGQKLPIC